MTKKTPEDICRAAVREIYAAIPSIVSTLIEHAKKGSCAHAKFLFEFADVAGLEAATDEEDLGLTLLKQLQSAAENALQASEQTSSTVK
jgi:hypothetical protein